MRVVILHFLDTENKKHCSVLQQLSIGASSKGHQVDVVNGFKEFETFRVTPYEYVAVVAAGVSPFSSKISPKVSEVLSGCGNIGGKKGCALVMKNFLFPQKLCSVLMKTMEREGMLLDYFDVIESSDHAAHVGKKIG